MFGSVLVAAVLAIVSWKGMIVALIAQVAGWLVHVGVVSHG